MDTYHDGGNNSELDAQKETFKNRLSEAIDKLLTLENTDTYVDDALGAVIKLVDDVVAPSRVLSGSSLERPMEKNMRTRRLSTLDWRVWKAFSGIWRIKLANLR